MKAAFSAFCDDISTITKRHFRAFEAFVRGSPRPRGPYAAHGPDQRTPPFDTRLPHMPQPAPAPKPNLKLNLKLNLKSNLTPVLKPNPKPTTSYAQAAAKPASPSPVTPAPSAPAHVARSVSGFAIYTQLRLTLRQHLKEVRVTKTGFALKPSSPDILPELESQTPAIAGFFGEDCAVERALNWVSYRIAFVPRSVAVISGSGEAIQDEVTSELLSSAIAEASSHNPAAITQTPLSPASPYDYTTSWIARFPNNTQTLPRSLVFGV